MGKSNGSKVEVAQYYMSSWWGFAVGKVDKLLTIVIDDKDAWTGEVSESALIKVDDRDLFGGAKTGGGVQGSIAYLDGKDTQTIPTYLAAKFGMTPSTCPAHRGVASLFFSGGVEGLGGTYGNGRTYSVSLESDFAGGLTEAYGSEALSDEKGFYWRSNNPSVPPIKIKAQRAPKGLNALYAMIGDDANPIHIIYEVMTNDDWGMGAPETSLNTSLWEDVAHTIFNEGIGISVLWKDQQSGEDFIAGVLGYVNGLIFTNPRNGLLEIKLIRGDYDIGDMPVIDPDNSDLSEPQRKLWGETVNEIVVSWTNPITEEEETVSAYDPANIAIQGGVVSDSKSYLGVRNPDLAMKLAMRDLRVSAAPLFTCKAIVNRSGWDLVPGSVVKMNWPEENVSGVAMRVMGVDYGNTGDSKIKLNLMEDSFALDAGDYIVPPGTFWDGSAIDPKNLDHVLVMTLPYYLVARMGANPADMTYPEVRVGVLGADAAKDLTQYIITYEGTDSDGAVVWKGSETRTLLSYATTTGAIAFATGTTTVGIGTPTPGKGVKVGSIIIIGSGGEADREIGVVTAVGASSVTFKRGMMDTVPRAWSTGTPCWFVPLSADIMEDVARDGESAISYKLLTTTTAGTLDSDAATTYTATLTPRQWLPLRPANCKVNGQANGPVSAPGASSLSLTWANRNRLFEDSVLTSWTGATVVSEAGQTTTITVLDDDGVTVLATVDGLTGTSYTLLTSAFGTSTHGFIKFTSKRTEGWDDVYESLQGHLIEVTL